MPNFSIPLSGLTAESTALSAIANNLSNQNTTGYKGTSVLFSDLFYQNLGTTGSGDPIQVGAGTKVGSMPALFTQGSVSSTGVPTDVAIQGTGFFAVQGLDGVVRYGMPRACSELGVLRRVVALSDIPAQILLATRQRRRA
jgi:flagellar hook protein FlgE